MAQKHATSVDDECSPNQTTSLIIPAEIPLSSRRYLHLHQPSSRTIKMLCLCMVLKSPISLILRHSSELRHCGLSLVVTRRNYIELSFLLQVADVCQNIPFLWQVFSTKRIYHTTKIYIRTGLIQFLMYLHRIQTRPTDLLPPCTRRHTPRYHPHQHHSANTKNPVVHHPIYCSYILQC